MMQFLSALDPVNKAKVLIMHRGRPHFETLLAAIDVLRYSTSITIASDHLHVFQRVKCLEYIGFSQGKLDDRYDYCVIISGDQPLLNPEIDTEMRELISKTPTIKFNHRLRQPDYFGDMFLFPSDQRAFVPVSTGLPQIVGRTLSSASRSFLTQGNIENRRMYSVVPDLNREFPRALFRLVGIKVDLQLMHSEGIEVENDLPELEFHRSCAKSDFILPLIDPTRYGQYFLDRFTSSVQIGFSYQIPFVAHKKLFELYPIVGFSYEDDIGLRHAINQALSCDPDHYTEMRADLLKARQHLNQRNMQRIEVRLRSMD